MSDGLLALIRADVEEGVHRNFRQMRGWPYWSRLVGRVVGVPGTRAAIAFRVSHALAGRRLLPLAMWLRTRTLRHWGAEIHPRASIGPGLVLVHSNGIVIGPEVTVGARCRMFQGVTLGQPVHLGDGVWAAPRIGDDVTLGAHAVVLGNVHVGDGAVVGANSVVTKDVPPGVTVVGAPARPL